LPYCIDCGKFKSRGALRCNSCAQIYRRSKEPKAVIPTNYCVDCDRQIGRYSKRCKHCAQIENWRIRRKNPKPTEFTNSCIDCGAPIGRYGLRCKSCAISGVFNPNWRDGSTGSPYGLGFGPEKKRYIKDRDDHTCVLCGTDKGTLYVHHINYDKTDNTPGNLVTLCNSCHGKTNYNREHWIGKFHQIGVSRV